MNERQENNNRGLEIINTIIAERLRAIMFRFKNLPYPYNEILDFRGPKDIGRFEFATFHWKDEGPAGLASQFFHFTMRSTRENYYKEDCLTTIYGNLPHQIIGSNNRVYEIFNSYNFDLNGKAAKNERISDPRRGQKKQNSYRYLKMFGYSDEEIKQARRVPFVPVEGERFVPVSPGEYEVIFSYLDQIDAGKLMLAKTF